LGWVGYNFSSKTLGWVGLGQRANGLGRVGLKNFDPLPTLSGLGLLALKQPLN